MTRTNCTNSELLHTANNLSPAFQSKIVNLTRVPQPSLALPMSGDPQAWEMTAQFTDLEYTALALLLKKITFADVASILNRIDDSDPDVADLIEYAHSALMELDDSLELAAEIGECV